MKIALQSKESKKKKIDDEKRVNDKNKSESVSKNKEEKRKKIEAYLSFIDDDVLTRINKEFIENNKTTVHMGKYLVNETIDLNNSVVRINYYTFIYNKCINKIDNFD